MTTTTEATAAGLRNLQTSLRTIPADQLTHLANRWAALPGRAAAEARHLIDEEMEWRNAVRQAVGHPPAPLDLGDIPAIVRPGSLPQMPDGLLYAVAATPLNGAPATAADLVDTYGSADPDVLRERFALAEDVELAARLTGRVAA